MGNQKSSYVFGKRSPILFGICAVVFAVVGIVTFRDYGDGSWMCRTKWFWWRLLWFEAIFALFWFAAFGVPISRLLQNRRMTGATYAIVASICLRASLVSFLVWGVGSFISPGTPFSVLPITVQLLVVLYFGVTVFMFPKTQALQTDGMELPVKYGLPSPSELANTLDTLEHRLESDIDVKTIKRIKETIRYSLPSVGRIAECDAYRQLVACIVRISNSPSIDITQACKMMEELLHKTVEFCKR